MLYIGFEMIGRAFSGQRGRFVRKDANHALATPYLPVLHHVRWCAAGAGTAKATSTPPSPHPSRFQKVHRLRRLRTPGLGNLPDTLRAPALLLLRNKQSSACLKAPDTWEDNEPTRYANAPDTAAVRPKENFVQ